MIGFAVKFIKSFSKNDMIGTAAQTTFFLILSFPPLMVLALSIISNINLSDTILSVLEYVFPANVSDVFSSLVLSLPKSSGITLISALGLIFSASGSIWALMRGIHKAYTYEKLSFSIKDRLLALIFTTLFILSVAVSLGSIIIVSLFSAIIDTISSYSLLFTISKRIIPAMLIFIFVYFIYRFTPGVGLKGKQLFTGAAFSAVGWVLVSMLFGIYISSFTKYTTVYGSIGAFFILILWLYVISLIVLTGAQINGTLNELNSGRHNIL